jgi:hypothetical protein
MSQPINAAAYARSLFAKGRSFDAVVNAIIAQGRSRNGARMAALRALRAPDAKEVAAPGTASGVVCSFKLPDELVSMLRNAAAKRGISAHKLTSDVMAAVIDDDLFDAVLDESGGAK